jgi:hypothetical protein
LLKLINGKNAMTTTSESLAAKADEFKTFFSSSVRPVIGLLTEMELEKLCYLDIAMRINDIAIRERYCTLAIALLNTNIAYYVPDATLITVPPYDNTAVVTSTLIAAAIVQYLGGTSMALFAAAAWYFSVVKQSLISRKKLIESADAHNAMVADWCETIQVWESTRNNLQSLLGITTLVSAN